MENTILMTQPKNPDKPSPEATGKLPDVFRELHEFPRGCPFRSAHRKTEN